MVQLADVLLEEVITEKDSLLFSMDGFPLYVDREGVCYGFH
jgi:hypothetical protein